VIALSTDNAFGIDADGVNYGVHVTVDGYLYSRSLYGVALGAEVFGYGDYTNVGGSVTAIADNSIAEGLLSVNFGSGSNYVHVGGDVFAYGYFGAVGIGAYGGDVDVRVDGSVTAEAVVGNATGVNVVGDSYIYVGGNVFAETVVG